LKNRDEKLHYGMSHKIIAILSENALRHKLKIHSGSSVRENSFSIDMKFNDADTMKVGT